MMRIVENNSERLVLKGTPGSIRWMVFAVLLGLALMSATGWFIRALIDESGIGAPLLPLGIGFALGAAFFLIGAATLCVGHMRLVFDRTTGTGNYEVRSPIIDVGKPCSFRLEHIDSVTVERSAEARPRDVDHSGFPAKVCRARLRLRKPRRALVLDETENGRAHRVQAVADAVAAWLETDVTQLP